MTNDEAAGNTIATLQALIKNAVLEGYKYCICVEGKDRSTVVAGGNLDGDIKTARFLEKFARQFRAK